MMSLETFAKVMDECGKYVRKIDMYNWGEPFLNTDICKMVADARKRKIEVTISTNLNKFGEEVAIALIQSKLNVLIVSLDGASHESVNAYQGGCDFQAVIRNMEMLVAQRKKLKSTLPYLQWRFLVNRHNEHELEKARELARKVGVDEIDFGAFRCDMGREVLLSHEEKVQNISSWLPQRSDLLKYTYSGGPRSAGKAACRFLWFESVIQPNGSVSPCCAVWPEKYDFGNIHEISFKDIWNGDKYRAARQISTSGSLKMSKRNENICLICKQNGGLMY